MQKLNIQGKKFTRLIVIKEVGRNKYNRSLWKCRCDCGNFIVTTTNHLMTKNTQSCGCLFKELLLKRIKTHGNSNKLIYRIWQDMKDRCLNSRHQMFKNYGGRGIVVCKKWLKFENFYKDMGDRPKDKSLDRINNNKGYSKENCRWATRGEQSRNKRSNKFITFKGKTQCLSDWANELKIPVVTLWNRIYRYKFSLEKSLSSKKYG